MTKLGHGDLEPGVGSAFAELRRRWPQIVGGKVGRYERHDGATVFIGEILVEGDAAARLEVLVGFVRAVLAELGFARWGGDPDFSELLVRRVGPEGEADLAAWRLGSDRMIVDDLLRR